MERILGIDLGTTNSMAAFVGPKGLEVVENERATTQTPSVVTLSPTGVLVGRDALAARITYPDTTFYSFKRFMGRGAEDVAEDLSRLPYEVRIGERDHLLLGPLGQGKSPEELSALVLRQIKKEAETVLGEEIKKAVITVPAYFDDGQRQATRVAAELAGLEPVRILNEPTAAALAYGLEEKGEGKILVYDFGWGTFDVSILELKGKLFKVLATHGDTHLGGDDLDQILMDWAQEELLTKPTPQDRQALKQGCEALKIALTGQLEAEVELNLERGRHVLKLTREEFNRLITPKVAETLEHIHLALRAADLTPGEIAEVVMVGGSSRIPWVRQKIQELFGKSPHVRLNPDQVVALGAGRQAHLLAGGEKNFLLMDVIPLSLGLETLGGAFNKMIMKNASIPAKVTEEFSTSADNQTGITLNIFQGEREFVKDCRKLGQFILKGIPPMPAGLPRVKVTFFVDANGLLVVSAKEERSGVEAEIEVIPTHGLKQSEVSRMIKDSFEHAAEDFASRNLVEFRAKAEMVEAGLRRVWEKVKSLRGPEEIQALEAQMARVKAAAEGEEATLLKKELDLLGDLTRDLADEIMGLAAKEVLLEP